MKHLRFIFAKVLFCKLILAFYIYNRGLYYFFEKHLEMPIRMARPFGKKIGSLLLNSENQIWLYMLLALWLAVAL